MNFKNRVARRGAAVVAATFGVLAILVPLAEPAGAATWSNAGNWIAYAQDGAITIGTTSLPLVRPTSPFQCGNGVNDDGSSVDAGGIAVQQDLLPDFSNVAASKDAECQQWNDEDEVQTGQQNKVIPQIAFTTNAAGTMSAITMTMPAQSIWGSGLAGGRVPVAVTQNASPTPTGTINPDTNAVNVSNLSLRLSISVPVPVLGTQNCRVDFTINPTTGTSGSLTGQAYDPTTGLTTMVDNNFALGALTGSGQCGTIGPGFGFPSAAGVSSIKLTTRVLKASGNTQPNVTGAVTSPASPSAGSLITITPTATDTGAANESLCTGSPCPTPAPTYNWRYVQTAGPVVGDSTVLPDDGSGTTGAGTAIRVLNNYNPVTGAAVFRAPTTGTYTFSICAGDGGAVLPFSGTCFTHNVVVNTAATTTVTVNGGSALSVSDNVTAANNPFKLSAVVQNPAPINAVGRTYAWSQSGSTCSTGTPLTFTTASAQTTTFAVADVTGDCQVTATMTSLGTTGSVTVNITNVAGSTGTISGTVTGCAPACSALSGASVLAFQVTGATSIVYSASATTNVSGAYSITGLPAGSFKLLFQAPGYAPRWFANGGVAQSSPAVWNGQKNINQALYSTSGGTGTLSGTVTVQPSGNAPNGTSVRLYDGNTGFFVGKTTTTSGAYSFTQLPPGPYKVQAAGASPGTLGTVWADTGSNVSTATPKTVTSGGTTTVNMKLGTVAGTNAGGTVSSSTTTSVTIALPTATSCQGTGGACWTGWAVNQWAGGYIAITSGTLSGSQRLIASNTATTITISTTAPNAAWASAPAAGVTFMLFKPTTGIMGISTAAKQACLSILSGLANAYFDDSTASFGATGALAGYRVRIVNGDGVGYTYTISTNSGTRIEFLQFADGPTGVSILNGCGSNTGAALNTGNGRSTTGGMLYYIENPATANANNAVVWGGVADSTGAGVPINSPNQTEVRLYDATSGVFSGRARVADNIGTTTAYPAAGANAGTGRGPHSQKWGVNFNFERWTADPLYPNAQQGVTPGQYKVLFRVKGTGGAATALCSGWIGGAAGGPAAGSYDPTMSVTQAATQTFNAGSINLIKVNLRQNAACSSTTYYN